MENPSLGRQVSWSDHIDDIFGGDLVVAVGMPTPERGVVLAGVTPVGLRDRTAGTVSFTTSLGFGRKLERIAADPRIAVAYHTRQHGHVDHPGYALVQGTASVRSLVSEQERAQLTEQAAAHLGQMVSGRFWAWWLKVYALDRVLVTVHVHRILWWPDGALSADPLVLGTPLPEPSAASQSPPRDARTPRVGMRRVARSARRGHRLLGVLLTDGMPLILPVRVPEVHASGLTVATDSKLMPVGGRRAGFLAHDFHPGLVGLWTATHTGWLEVADSAAWTPHTRHFFVAPPNKTLLLLGNGLAARWGYRRAIKQGREAILQHDGTVAG